MKTNNPLVTIIVLTYNEEEYVSKCLDGILMQQVNFPYEVKIYDDASTDNTQAVIQQYVDKYPGVFEAHLYKINYYSQGMQFYGEKQGYRTAKGKYIALCEGDDYWTDPLKLQKQVDFLESHPDYSVCFHCYRNYNIYTQKYTMPNNLSQMMIDGIDSEFSLDNFFEKWVTMPLTCLFRLSMFDINYADKYKYFRDSHLFYHLLKAGKGYFFAFDGAVRTQRKEGMASLISQKQYCDFALKVSREFFFKNLDRYTREYYLVLLRQNIELYMTSNKWRASWYNFVFLLFSGRLRSYVGQQRKIHLA